MNTPLPTSLDFATLAAAYRRGLKPSALFAHLHERAAADSHRAWISLLPKEKLLALAVALEQRSPDDLPLYGLPFAIKDNIDFAGLPTTAGCPDYSYAPERHAVVIEKLIAAGAIPLGKTNLDQFATGLNGTRSPYGACRNAFKPDYISGGSSSGSAVSVADGQVSFSLGTDTAGSGRVPAAFNNLVGLKPTCGVLSSSGLVPACRSLDSISIFALTAADAGMVFSVVQGFDAADAYSRPLQPHGRRFPEGSPFRFGVPRTDQLAFFGDAENPELFADAVARLSALGGTPVELDFSPFLETARLLYGGPWVAERYHAIKDFIERQPESVFPVTREITLGGARATAVEAFDAQYRLKSLKRRCDEAWQLVDLIITPTAGSHPTIAAVEADPIRINSELGYYTNFMNLLDYSAVAVPAAMRSDGLPFGVTLCAPAHQDLPLLELAARWQEHTALPLGATGQSLSPSPVSFSGIADGMVRVAVCGAHLSGLPLNWQLTERGGRLIGATRSAPEYRFYALVGGPPLRPGMVRVDQGGAKIEMEVWELPASNFGSFVAGIPAPLGIGKVRLEDGSQVSGFICEGLGISGGEDITAFGGWRAWLNQRQG
ncbi:MAG: allophanate hydrolase [Betaproteobacteria bacterium HGW-Betaproteobacteria-7]|nr:MAG: allophanate hydrolase [Betaproteobacteria bacterium HGW-Betaproteobacteria-7]